MSISDMQFSSATVDRDLKIQQFMTQNSAGHWLAVDENAIIRGIQPKLASRLGYHRVPQVIGSNVSMFIPSHIKKDGKHDKLVTSYFETSSPRSMGDRDTIDIVDIEGTKHPVLISLIPFNDTFCDGMCLIDYTGILELTFAEIFFCKDLRLTRSIRE